MKKEIDATKKVIAKKKTTVPSSKRSDVKSTKRFPIVAIGASAGGLEAITELLKNVSANTGMAFIYVQHLSPDHESYLTSLLAKATKMKVYEIKNKMPIEANSVYVIPPNKEINVIDGHIKVTVRPKVPVTNLPIDTLFSSLAETHKEQAIGVILSGSGSDGTRGMKAIKYSGGLTFAQDDSAKFVSMPQSTIAAGSVDFILSPKEIALEISRLSKHPFLKVNDIKATKEDLVDDNDPDLKIILNLLYKSTDVNFSLYKINTIKRRIVRRMLLYKINTLKDYAKLLIDKSLEIDVLYQDLLINVTSFFRDTDTHQYLKSTLLPQLLKSKKPGEILRIWIPACATGEEAYSIAMMLAEIQGSKNTAIPVQIFATDLSGNAIKKARLGLYSKQEIELVSPKRIQLFFTKTDGSFRISKAVRDMCVFAQHNILSDPPFSRLDFISCCNLFIYLDTTAQKKALTTFHYALNDDGYLMLGKSETIGSSTHLFTGLNKKFKVFARKKLSGARALPNLSSRFSGISIPNENIPGNVIPLKNKANVSARVLDSAIDSVLVSEFMPPSLVINYAMEILQFRGTTDLYLTHGPGKATFNVLKMTRPEIAFELRSAISKSIKTSQRVRKTGVEIKIDATVKSISIEVVPLKIEWDEPLLLILFNEQEQVETVDDSNNGKKNRSTSIIAKDRRIKKLEDELAAVHADLLSLSQEHETFTEQLQSANEEVVSSNEELLTMNEELETSKEEIQSANEELSTTNQELRTRNELLNESYGYAEAINATMHDSLLVLDKNLRVKSANKPFYRTFHVKEEDTEGILLFDLGNKQWDIPALRNLLQNIIPQKTYFHDFEITHSFPAIGEKTMLLNASRIIQKTHHEELILLAIADVTEVRKKAIQLSNKEKQLLAAEIDSQKNIAKASQSFAKQLEVQVGERTYELQQSNEMLEEKYLELKKMNKELEAFNYVSSHDLQEPLRKIQTFVTLIIESENLTDKGKDYLLRMQVGAQRMQQLIEDLLLFSRTNTSDKQFENTDLNIIMEEVRVEFKDALLKKNATLKVGKLCHAYVIPFQFRQLIHNLIGNALKFSNPHIPPHILVSSNNVKYSKLNNANLPQKKEYCHIIVEDNGIGFEPKFSEKVFEVFQRLHSKEEYSGTGIGLAIVKKIVEHHHGIITASSKVNKGTRFDIFIPSEL